jgi:hypothetical protein
MISKIDHEKVLRAEIMAVLCMKNEWIPVLPEHDATHMNDDTFFFHDYNQAIPEDDGDAPIVSSGDPRRRFISPTGSLHQKTAMTMIGILARSSRPQFQAF